jgi:hypothetical protein
VSPSTSTRTTPRGVQIRFDPAGRDEHSELPAYDAQTEDQRRVTQLLDERDRESESSKRAVIAEEIRDALRGRCLGSQAGPRPSTTIFIAAMRVRIDRTYGLHDVQRFANEVARSFASREKTICCPQADPSGTACRVQRAVAGRGKPTTAGQGSVTTRWPDPVDWSTRNESGGWGRQDPVLVPGVRRCGDYPVEGVSVGAGR